jgi:hypothetical protein
MIEFTHKTTQYRLKPENAQAYRAALDKPKKHKPEALSTKNLRRDYPIFEPGMKTADYLVLYGALNSRLFLTTLEYAHADRAAAMLDPTQPEVLEELDPDYTPPFLATPKAKKQTVASLKLSIGEALALLAKGDIDTAQCVLNEALEGVN